MFRKVALAALLLMSILLVSNTSAAPIPFNPAGTGNIGTVYNVAIWDPGPGNAGQFATIPLGQNGNQSGPTLFQANMSALKDSMSNNIIGTGLGTSFQLITRAAVNESVTVTVTNTGGANNKGQATASFGLASGGLNTFQLAIVNNGTGGNNNTGAGFNSGTIILSGTFSSVSGNFTLDFDTNGNLPIGQLEPVLDPSDPRLTVGTLLSAGNGNQTFVVDVNYYDPNYFPLAPNTVLDQIILSSQTVLPFQTVPALDPNGVFWINSGTPSGFTPNTGAINGVTGPDILLQTDGSFIITTRQIPFEIPEPATLAVVGLMAGVGGLVYRQRRNVKFAA